MTRPGFVDQQDLLRWAETLPAKGQLPRLIRRLVLETGSGVGGVDFPAGEGISVGGWDGVARAQGEGPFVAAGLSLWELSAGRRTAKKADEDYAKRTTTPDGSPTNEATYSAVSVRRWSGRRAWAGAKTATGVWKEVRAYGVDDLETWLEAAPVTHAWLSELLGLEPFGVRTPTTWWDAWGTATDPPLTTAVVLAGRDASAQALRERLADPAQLTTLCADSLDEALAFITAVLICDDESSAATATGALARAEAIPADIGSLLARTLFVDNVAAWRRLAEHSRELVLIARTPDVIAEARSTTRHHVIVPLSNAPRADVLLEPVDATIAAAALKDGGLSDERANDAGRLGGRSLLALRRHLAAKPELHTPPWATPPIPRTVRAALLAGAWQDGVPGDCDRVAELAGISYDDLREELEAIAAAPDPFVTRVDDTWLVVSTFDAWRQLAAYLRPADLQRAPALVAAVLLENDPAADLPADERWRAAWDGTQRAHSATLRAGLATTVAVLGAMAGAIDAGGGATGADVSALIVHDLLAAANDDGTGRRWAVLAPVLPLLAEAAPDPFLDGVRAGLAGEPPLLRMIFRDNDADDRGYDPMFSSAPHTFLLWALETTAWSPDHLGQSVDLLARLAEIDPGGRLSNRPAESLESILCPWHPETTAAVARRLEIIDGLRRRRAAVSWSLMLALLPETGELHSPTHAPRYRDWRPATHRVSQSEWFDAITGLVDRLIDDAGDDAGRWREFLDAATDLLPSDWQRVREALAARVAAGAFGDNGREALWKVLRALAAQHREYPEADRAFSVDEVEAIEALAETLRPQDAIAQHAWLFEDHLPDLGDASKTKEGQYDPAGYEAALTQRRRAAARAVLDAHGWDGIIQLAATAAVPFELGRAAAEADGGEHDATALDLLGDDGPRDIANGYVAARIAIGGSSWVDEQLRTLDPVRQGRLLLLTRDCPTAWERADELGAEAAAEFWRGFSPFGLGHRFEPLAIAANRLLGAARPTSALQLLNLYAVRDDDAPATLAVTAADALDAYLGLKAPEAAVSRLGQYELQQLFRSLERHRNVVGVDRVARLEWQFLPALGFRPDVASLHEALALDPSLFVELVSTVYRPRDAEPEPVSTEQQERASNAYRLLSSWTRPPGTLPEGGFNAAELNAWVDAVLPLLDTADRRGPGEEHIGMVLAFVPPGSDGAWPCEPVRDFLEERQLERVEHALRRQLYNCRGVTSRHPETGGDQERALAQQRRDQAVRFNDRWPRTAAVLRSLAESLEHDARRYDRDAERRRKGLD